MNERTKAIWALFRLLLEKENFSNEDDYSLKQHVHRVMIRAVETIQKVGQQEEDVYHDLSPYN